MNKLIIANWKMNPQTIAEAVRLARAEDKKGVVIVPPFPFLKSVKGVLKNASLGAQDVFFEEKGAYTGEVSPVMLKKLGASYAIVGHSERRRLGESDKIIAKKVKAGMDAGLKVILCVGEPKRVSGIGYQASSIAKRYVKKQLTEDVKGIRNKELGIRNLIIAYEPVWAIGTGKNASPEDAAEIAAFIHQLFNSKFHIPNSRVLYGGSTNSRNARSFLEREGIDGLLVGGASIDPKEFVKMIKIGESIR